MKYAKKAIRVDDNEAAFRHDQGLALKESPVGFFFHGAPQGSSTVAVDGVIVPSVPPNDSAGLPMGKAGGVGFANGFNAEGAPGAPKRLELDRLLKP